MFEFYKRRDFGGLISDSFAFFKIYGKNYFKNYFLINGLILILMMVLAVVGYREFFSQMFGSNMEGQSRYFEEYRNFDFNNIADFHIVFGSGYYQLLFPCTIHEKSQRNRKYRHQNR